MLMLERPSKVVYANNGQTKITLTGRMFFMTGEEIEAEYELRLEAGDPWAVRINNVLWEINDNYVRRMQEAAKHDNS